MTFTDLIRIHQTRAETKARRIHTPAPRQDRKRTDTPVVYTDWASI